MMLSVEEIGSKDVINKLNESDIFSSKQLFVLRNPNSLRGKTRDELVEYCSNPNSNNYLVLIQDEYGIKISLLNHWYLFPIPFLFQLHLIVN